MNLLNGGFWELFSPLNFVKHLMFMAGGGSGGGCDARVRHRRVRHVREREGVHGPRDLRADDQLARAGDGVVRVGVVEVVRIHAEHQRLARRELVIHTGVREALSVATDVGQASVGGQHERRKR